MRPLGSQESFNCDVRLIFASSTSLRKLLLENKMRQDFYFRINSGFSIYLKSLSEDREILKKTLENYQNDFGVTLSPELEDFYLNFSWPGNYRQLRSHFEKKFLIQKGIYWRFDDHDMCLLNPNCDIRNIPSLTMKEYKILLAKKIFYRCEGDFKKASNLLNVTESTLKKLCKAL